jgi:hypothetical protein
MTYEQTREQFLLAWNSNAYLNMCESDDMHNAIVALEKQIPRKPIDKIDPMFGDICIVCSNCENTDIVNPFTHSIFKHCPNCGQALDWSDNNA